MLKMALSSRWHFCREVSLDNDVRAYYFSALAITRNHCLTLNDRATDWLAHL